MHLGWGHQASLETIKIKEQLIFELYPEDSVCVHLSLRDECYHDEPEVHLHPPLLHAEEGLPAQLTLL